MHNYDNGERSLELSEAISYCLNELNELKAISTKRINQIADKYIH